MQQSSKSKDAIKTQCFTFVNTGALKIFSGFDFHRTAKCIHQKN